VGLNQSTAAGGIRQTQKLEGLNPSTAAGGIKPKQSSWWD